MLSRSLVAFILRFVKQQWFLFCLTLLMVVIVSILERLTPWFTKLLIDSLTQDNSNIDSNPPHLFRLLTFPCIGFIVTRLAIEIFDKTRRMLSIHLWPTFRRNIRTAILLYLQGQSHSYFVNHFTGVISNKIERLPQACELIVQIIIEHFLYTLITLAISLVLFAQINIIFTTILFGFMVSFLLISLLSMKSIGRTAKIHAETIATLNGQVVDHTSCMLTVRLFARSNYEIDNLDHYQVDEINKAKQATWAIEKAEIFKGCLFVIFSCTILMVFIHQWTHHLVSLGDFSLITLTNTHISKTLWHLSWDINQIAKEIGAAQAAKTFLYQPYMVKDAMGAKPLLVTKGTISFDQVSFAYIPDHPILKQISIQIPSGQKVGLVGFSGAGKSTFVHLLVRLYDPQTGSILIDNHNISTITQQSLHEQIAVISQDPILFHRTIFENIRYGRLDATEAEVVHAMKLAHCEEFIQYLTEGRDTVVGERGVKLSGGQRQRIAIARAILKNAPILIMDEATSALDSVTERFIQERLPTVMADCTTLVIAHRLSTLHHMDRIVVFHQGSIIEDATLPELLAKKGHFAHMWNMQVNGLFPQQERSIIPSPV